MTQSYDLPHELQAKLEKVLVALYNVPEVGQVYDQQHSDTHLAATLDLKDVIDNFKTGNLRYND